jgi:hypothetical protein
MSEDALKRATISTFPGDLKYELQWERADRLPTSEKALDCFQRTHMEVLAIGPFLAVKPEVKDRNLRALSTRV